MSDKTSIEWTDATWNPVAAFLREEVKIEIGPKTKIIPKGTRGWFCTKVSPGCAHCYAERINVRLGNGLLYIPANLVRIEWGFVGLDAPLKWKRPRMIFTDSMDDFFHEAKPERLIDQVFAVMAIAHDHTFQVLTKRSKRAREYLSCPQRRLKIAAVITVDYAAKKYPCLMHLVDQLESGEAWPLRNVAIGASVENQQFADSRIPELLRTPAAVRFLSYEPALGPVNFGSYKAWVRATARDEDGRALWSDDSEIDWVICGGESGLRARPMHPNWARSARDQCVDAGIAFHFKQWGEWVSVSEGAGPGEHFSFPDGATVRRAGKKRAGRTLDGRTWDEFPDFKLKTKGGDKNGSRKEN